MVMNMEHNLMYGNEYGAQRMVMNMEHIAEGRTCGQFPQLLQCIWLVVEHARPSRSYCTKHASHLPTCCFTFLGHPHRSVSLSMAAAAHTHGQQG